MAELCTTSVRSSVSVLIEYRAALKNMRRKSSLQFGDELLVNAPSC